MLVKLFFLLNLLDQPVDSHAKFFFIYYIRGICSMHEALQMSNFHNSNLQYPAWPTSLHEFLQLTSQLSLLRGQIDLQPTAIDANMARGMNQKKLHEVSYMASLVHNVMSEAGCDLIVDVGSGLVS